MSITKRFLAKFFEGSWALYGHYTLSCMVSLAAVILGSHLAFVVSGFLVMGVLEYVQKRYDTGWDWTDVKYNAYGTLTAFAVVALAALVHNDILNFLL